MQPPYIPVIVQYGHTQAVVLPAFGIVRTVCISFFAHEHSLGNRPLRSAGVISFLILRFFVLSFRYRPFFRHIVPRRPGLSGRDAQTAGMPDPICARYPGCTLCHKRRLWIVRCCLSALHRWYILSLYAKRRSISLIPVTCGSGATGHICPIVGDIAYCVRF